MKINLSGLALSIAEGKKKVRNDTLEEVAKMLEAKAEEDGSDSGVCLYWAYRLRMMMEGK